LVGSTLKTGCATIRLAGSSLLRKRSPIYGFQAQNKKPSKHKVASTFLTWLTIENQGLRKKRGKIAF